MALAAVNNKIDARKLALQLSVLKENIEKYGTPEEIKAKMAALRCEYDALKAEHTADGSPFWLCGERHPRDAKLAQMWRNYRELDARLRIVTPPDLGTELFYENHFAECDPQTSVIAGGSVYTICNEDADWRGHGGKKFRIRFHDGREAVTTNLWSKGDLHPMLACLYPDNATLEAM